MALIILVALALGALAYEMLRPSEPLYQGKTLIAWLEHGHLEAPWTNTESEDAVAIRHFGTNSIPTLIKMLHTEGSPSGKKIMNLVNHLSFLHVNLHGDYEYRDMAAYGFFALGPAGKPAVPELLSMLASTNAEDIAAAATSLSFMGSNADVAVPAFVRLLDYPDPYVKGWMTIALRRLHRRPEIAVPCLITNLSTTNVNFLETIDALRAYGKDAKSSVPFLLPFLTNNDADARRLTTKALKAIDPEAAEKAGIK